MPFTYDMNLPTVEELKVDEINISLAALLAGAHQLGKACEKENNEFILCRRETRDPRKCLEEGKEVTKCALNFFRRIKKECRHEFEQFANCINRSSSSWDYSPCRKTQAIFDKCALERLELERPPWGWCAEIHVHKTDREKPDPDADKPVFTEIPDKYIPGEDKRKAKHGVRSYLF